MKADLAALAYLVSGVLFILALPWGPKGIAAAWTASFWILTLPAFWFAGRPIQLGIAAVVGVVWKYLVASLLAGCTCFAFVQRFPQLMEMAGPLGAFTRIATISTLFGTLYLGAVVMLYRGFAPLLQVVRLLRDMLPRSSTQSLPQDDSAAADQATAREKACLASAD
jgi:hypothetical protein